MRKEKLKEFIIETVAEALKQGDNGDINYSDLSKYISIIDLRKVPEINRIRTILLSLLDYLELDWETEKIIFTPRKEKK